jgi:putative iron-dependent peroxidase
MQSEARHESGWTNIEVQIQESDVSNVQTAVIDRGKAHALFIGYKLQDNFDERIVKSCISNIPKWTKKIMAENKNKHIVSAIGIENKVWRKFDANPPKELASFADIKTKNEDRVVFQAEYDDLYFIVKSDALDLCELLASWVMEELNKAGLSSLEKIVGFLHEPTTRYDINLGRDLTGFIDGSRNPGCNLAEVLDSVLITRREDPKHIGGSFVYISKFIHNLEKFHSLKTEEKNVIIGRDITKEVASYPDNIPENPFFGESLGFRNSYCA